MLLRGPPLSPGVVRGVGTTSRDPLPRAPLSVGASAAEWEILDGKRVDLLTVSGTVPVLLKSTIYFLTALARFRAEGVVKRWGAHCVLFGWGSISGKRL